MFRQKRNKLVLLFLIFTSSSFLFSQTLEHSGVHPKYNIDKYITELKKSSLQSIRMIIVADPELFSTDREFFTGSSDYKHWQLSTAQMFENAMKVHLISSYPDTVDVVDRKEVDRAIDELNLQLSGLIVTDNVVNVGSFLGATHFHKTSMSRESLSGNPKQTIVMELIDIETMEVVAMDILSYIYSDAFISFEESTPFQRFLNYREVIITKEGQEFYK